MKRTCCPAVTALAPRARDDGTGEHRAYSVRVLHPSEQPPASGFRHRLHEIIFEADTPAGKAFDVVLLVTILLSVTTVALESVAAIRERFGEELRAAEWFFTGLFTLEYVLRMVAVSKPLRYARSFFGLVDLLALLPTYLSMMLPGAQSLLVVRVIRLLRVFRVLKLASFLGQADILLTALRASRQKIIVFLGGVLSTVVIMGSVGRDEKYFPDGERFDIDRPVPQNIPFGHGAHFCLGAQLAKLEVRLALDALLTRCARISPVPEPVQWHRSMVVRGPSSVQVVLHGA